LSTSDAGPGLRLVPDADRFGLWRTARPKVALTIAGLDPSGGAGIVADLRTFDALGVYGMAIVATLTVQSTGGLDGRHDVPPRLVERQIEAVFEDKRPDAVKIGALGGAGMVEGVSRALKSYDYTGPVVVDPVLAGSDGGALLEPDALEPFKELLVPRATVLTPNCAEVSVLCGFDVFEVGDVEAAALRLVSMGASAVLVTGWKTMDEGKSYATDVFCRDRDIEVMTSPWMEEAGIHGTGCVLSAAIAAGLARDRELRASVSDARRLVASAMRAAVTPGSGAPVANPYSLLRTRPAGRTKGGKS
jgi:hydroxymethylpyrimidine kinase/phosphomethylpyrimidine kinase